MARISRADCLRVLKILAQQCKQPVLVLHWVLIELNLSLDYQPVDILGSTKFQYLFWTIGVDGMIEDKNREPRMSAGCVVEEVLAWNHQHSVLLWDFLLCETD